MFKRVRWKSLVVLTIIFGTVPVCFSINIPRQRMEFVGSVEAASGIRCRFTFSSFWKRKDVASGLLDDTTFTVPRPGFIRKWIYGCVPQSSSLPAQNPFGASEIALKTYIDKYRTSHLLNGYPCPDSIGPHLVERHLQIDSCPATFYVASLGGTNYREIELCIYVPEVPMMYRFTADTSAADDHIDREMQAILVSFHVEKVVPTGGKR